MRSRARRVSPASPTAPAPREYSESAFANRRRTGSAPVRDRKSTRLNSSHLVISYAVFCLKKKHELLALARLGDLLRGRSGLEHRRLSILALFGVQVADFLPVLPVDIPTGPTHRRPLDHVG